MPIKLIKRVNLYPKTKKISKSIVRRQESFKRYLLRKIQKFYGTRSSSLIMVSNNFMLHNYLKRNRCDFKICNHYIYRIPTNSNDSLKVLINIANISNLNNVLNELGFFRSSFPNEFRNKYIYLVLT